VSAVSASEHPCTRMDRLFQADALLKREDSRSLGLHWTSWPRLNGSLSVSANTPTLLPIEPLFFPNRWWAVRVTVGRGRETRYFCAPGPYLLHDKWDVYYLDKYIFYPVLFPPPESFDPSFCPSVSQK